MSAAKLPRQPHSRARATMTDVAAEAHVSVKTVYRVLRNDPAVTEETGRRVRAVIQRLGLQRRELWDTTLSAGLTYTIGLVVDDLANPFYSHISAGIEREARGLGYQLITASSEGSPRREQAVLQGLIARQVDGLIVVPSTGTHPADELESGTRPVVLVDRPVHGTSADIVVGDNEGGIRSAVEHLAAYGHRRIGFLGDDRHLWTARQRRETFVATTSRLGLAAPALVAMGPHTAESSTSVLSRWAGSAVTAVITGNNRVTLQVLGALRRLGLDLSLVGYDDFELAEFLEPPVTVVHQDPTSLGRRAAQQLFARIQGDESPPEQIVVPSRLIVRGSGAPQSTATQDGSSSTIASTGGSSSGSHGGRTSPTSRQPR